MDQADPARNFFDEGEEVDLYGVLGVEAAAPEAEIKRAYKRLALQFHPDKVSRSGLSAEAASRKFQQVSFAFGVLSNEGRRRRFDATGRTDELVFGDDGNVDWDEYFATLWQGEVSGQSLKEYKKKYQHSDEERQDILAAYEETSGSLEDILNAVPCLEILEDEERVVALIDAAIAAKDIKKLPLWTKSLKDDKGRKQMRARAKAETSEAEQAARELGVWDELFGDGKKGTRGKGKTMRGEAQGTGEGHDAESEPEEDEDEDEEDEEDEQPTRGKKTKKAPAPKAKAPAKSKPAAKGKGKRKAEAEDDEEEGDTAGLERLIAARQQQRKAGMSTMIEQMEARAKEEEAERLKGKGKKAKGGAAAASGSGGSKGKAKAAAKPAKRAPGPPLRNGTGATLPPDPLDDDEFERIQQKMLQKRDAAAAEPAEAKPKAKRAKKA